METDYKNKGPRKRYHKMLTTMVEDKMYDRLKAVSKKSKDLDKNENMSDIVRLGILKEIERRE